MGEKMSFWGKIRKFAIASFLIAALVFVASGCAGGANSGGYGGGTQAGGSDEASGLEESGDAGETLEVHYLDVGQGDCTLIRCGDHAMLIDAGNNGKGSAVWLYLTKLGISKLDYVVGTHPDADHIGGLDVILYKADCDVVLLPDYEKDTKTYEEVIDTMEEKNYKVTSPAAGDQYEFGEAFFTIVGPNRKYEDANNNSIAISMRHGENRFLFTGDAEEVSEQDMLGNGMDLSADVYKVSHHGSKTASTDAFLDAVSPDFAVISCGEGNTYGHPHAEVMNRFRTRGISVYRTDEQGAVIAYSDGEKISFNCSPSESWQAGEPIGASPSQKKEAEDSGEAPDNGVEASQDAGQATDGNAEITYIVNTNTHKFHLPDCDSAADIAEKNKAEYIGAMEELLERGYEPCKRCIGS